MTPLGLLWRGSWMLSIPLISPLFAYLNHNNSQVYSLVTDLDRLFPFVPAFIVPYVSWYGFIFAELIWLLCIDPDTYTNTLTAMLLGIIASYGVYAVFQTTVPRPEVQGSDIFSRLTKVLYQLDQPYNAFPSIHAMISYIIFLVSFQTKEHSPMFSTCAQGLSVLIIFSTMFLKQHVLLDVISGMLLGKSVLKGAEGLWRLVRELEYLWQPRAMESDISTTVSP